MIKAKKIDKFVGVGEALFNRQQYFDVPEKHFFADTNALLKQMNALNFRDEDILIKGSRSFEFERVSRALVQKGHETVMEINLNTLLNNLNFYKSRLKAGC